MVFLNTILLARNRGPDEFWRKRRIFKLAAHFRGRRRNCYSVAVRYVHRALVYATKGRRLKKADAAQLWEQRVTAACEELGFRYPLLREALARMNILLNRKTLADLAVWEPRTFKSLVNLSWKKASEDGLAGVADLGSPPPGVITRGMLK
ncbi:39S ribosomal protein L20, mitochondrial [Schistocerca americana]|uniref:39S ribosomal protein L20, mitochondrial n=1 Tax=Schistocerca americana TaxID=7009 RepID=UPI001F4FA6FD|nr:39S ribosomal protein L20, mitochondrial [Schistocerca americana]XP_047113999.1 39S ribosomal protein L20, mitochondrial [Schistocerca piceifrons]XP_049952559.1 39S ribosomal protein L20, mitochondrial [Schistocerca serialis cubense]